MEAIPPEIGIDIRASCPARPGLDRHPTGLLARRQTAGSPPARALLSSAGISSLHTPYAFAEVPLVVRPSARRRSARAGSRHRDPGPEGPRPRRVRRDLDVAEPAARLPDRARPRRGPDDRGHRRQPVPRLRRRHRGQLDRPRPSRGRRRDQGAGRRADPLLRVATSTCRSTPRPAASSRALTPIAGGRARAYLGNSGTEVVEAAIKLARFATKRPYVVAFLGAFHGRTYGSVSLTASKAKYHAGLRAAAAGRLPRAVRQGRGPALVRRGPVRQARPGRTRSRRSSSSRSRARAATSSPRTASSQGLREHLRPRTGSCSSPTRSSRAPDGPGRCGRSSTGASSRTSCSRAKGIASGMPLGALVARAELLEALGPGRARLDVRRQPGRLRRGAGDDRPARGRPRRQRRGARRAGARGASAAPRSLSGLVRDVRGRGPDARRRVRHRASTRRRSSGRPSSAACSSSSAASPVGPDVAGADGQPRPRWRRRSGSSARRSPRSPAGRRADPAGRRGGRRDDDGRGRRLTRSPRPRDTDP